MLLVVDDAGWIVDEIGRNLATHLPASLRARVVSGDWVSARDCIIHFIDRAWAWSDGVLDQVSSSNRLVGLWWHGRPDASEPTLREAFERLKQLHHRFERIQVTCSSGRDTLLAAGVPPERIVQLPEGVDVRMFRPPSNPEQRQRVRDELGIPAGATAIGCFQKDGSGWGDGNLPKLVKGPDVLADALTEFSRVRSVCAVLPGPARGYVTRRLSAAGVAFVAPGFIERTELPRLYHALDVYVSPSRDEGGPAGVLEAMASGVPVISTRTGMATDLIQHGTNGFLVPIGDPQALAAAMLELSGDAGLMASMASHARDTIVAYDWRAVATRYATELYAS